VALPYRTEIPTHPAIANGNEGQWLGKALVRDRTKNKTSELVLEIAAKYPGQMRIEVASSGLSIHLASIAIEQGRMQVILTREKKYLDLPASENAFGPLLPLRISPDDLMSFIFHFPFNLEKWSCKTQDDWTGACVLRDEAEGGVHAPATSTSSIGSGITTSIKYSGNSTRRLEFRSSTADLEIAIENVGAKVEVSPSAYHLSPPHGYSIEIR
jgi:hypothetical protein